MKVVAVAVALVGSGSLAHAADLGVRGPAGPATTPVPMSVPTWAGLYAGLHAGYLAAGGEITFPASSEFHFIDPKGFVGGALAGYQIQTGPWVYGLEADVAYVNAKETIDIGFAPTPTSGQLSTRIDWNSHLRGRAGYAYGNFLPFVAGGLALAGVDNKAIDNTAGATATWNDVRAGWSLGAGVDVRTAWPATLRLEYIYDNYGKATLPAQTIGPTAFAERDHKLDSHTLRAAVTWRF